MTNSAAVVRMGTREKALGILGVSGASISQMAVGGISELIQLSPGSFSARIGAGQVQLLSNKKAGAGEEEPGQVIAANQQALIHLPAWNMAPKRYNFILSPNPALLRFGQVSSPGLVSAAELQGSFLGFSAFKRIDLNEFEWIFNITAID